MRPAPRGLGVRLRHPFERVPRIAWGLFGAAVLVSSYWYLASEYRDQVKLRIADARAWRIDGPPCSRITPAEFLGNHKKGPRRFEYEGVTFFRRNGHVECAPIYEDGGTSDRFHPVCQFTSPGELLIRTPKGDWYFQPGPGQPATVFASRDAPPRCVLAAKLTLATMMGEDR